MTPPLILPGQAPVEEPESFVVCTDCGCVVSTAYLVAHDRHCPAHTGR